MEQNEVILVAGIINATGKMLYWRDKAGVKIGDYAVVENMKGYDLIKVVGIIETTEKDAKKFSNTNYNDMKNIIRVFDKELF